MELDGYGAGIPLNWMPKLPRWTASEAEKAPLVAGFDLLRSKGSRRFTKRWKSSMRAQERTTAWVPSGDTENPEMMPWKLVSLLIAPVAETN